MKNNKQRLFEMMNIVANTNYSLNEENIKGTQVMIRDVNPETVDIGEILPSYDVGDAGVKMIMPDDVNRWRNNFIELFGREGYIKKGATLPWKWNVIGNDKYDEWKNKYLTSKGDYLSGERDAGKSYGLD